MSPLLELDAVCKTFSIGGLFSRSRLEAVKNVSFAIDDAAPEIFTIVGESGQRQDHYRQDDPRQRDADIGHHPIRRQGRHAAALAGPAPGVHGQGATDFPEPVRGLQSAGRFSHELSGGQLQRVAVASALIPEPKLIVADEPVSMVDASLRMSIVNLFRTLRDELSVSIIYITHDLATAYYISDRVIIMHRGEVVESGRAQPVLDNPTHPYSIALKHAVLPPDPAGAAAALRQRRRAVDRLPEEGATRASAPGA